MNNNIINAIVEDGYNTTYITSLFVALFYNCNNDIRNILDEIPNEIDGIYLQELLKKKFIEMIRRNLCIYADVINQIRNYLFVIGWCNDNIDILLDNHELIDFFLFLTKKIKIETINIETLNINNGQLEVINNSKLSYIKIIPSNNNCSIKFLLDNWINYNINTNNNYYYKLSNIPPYIIIYIDRFDKYNKKNCSEIDIMKKIKFNNINDISQSSLRWEISSFICCSGNEVKTCKYYTIINNNTEWLKYGEGLIPSFNEINIHREINKKKIMSEVVLLLYKLCD
jgi:hypothetical protein